MEFTGERFVPGIEDEKLSIEHMQRYMSILPLVKNKRVLDIACGEGYGSSILGKKAADVTGMDIDEETIKWARKKYASETVRYKVGNIAQIPLEDHSIDVLVSFETIEHVDEELQQQFIKEAKRVLKEDGILIMSSPNKEIYSDKYDYHNEFHIKEFYFREFVDFIQQEFAELKIYNQGFQVASFIEPLDAHEKTLKRVGDRQHSTAGKYYIAIASNNPIEMDEISSVYVTHMGEYDELIDRILTLQDEEEERNHHIQILDKEIDKNRKDYDRVNKEKYVLEVKLSTVERNLNEANEEINRKNSDLDNMREELSNVTESYHTAKSELESVKAELVKKDEEVAAVLKEYTEKIELLQAENEAEKREIADLKQEVLNKQGWVEQLLEVERAYERDKATITYRMMVSVRRFADWCLPEYSKRRFFLGVLAKTIRHPILMSHVITPKRIKSYFRISRTVGMRDVLYQYNYTLKEEKVAVGMEKPDGTVEVNKVDTEQLENKSIEDYEPLSFKEWSNPDVTIVIPVYNQFAYTYACLESILKNSGEEIRYEVIIADDCSTDLTTSIQEIVSNITVAKTGGNCRFLLNCNNAAKQARGKYILFLNNDTQVQENWLEPLVSLMEKDESIGMTGSKLVYPDGKLQEAGGILWKDGSAWNYGRGKDASDPEYNYVKEVDYISGAAIMIRKALWEEIGGFDERYVPAYYEDTDFAFEVRKHGYRVVYQPLSVVVHFEGASNGTDVSEGLKHYQVENGKKFFEKWKDVLQSEHFANGENVFLAKDRGQFRKQMLVVDHYVPHFDKDAGGKCTYMYLMMFVKMGYKVTFIGDNFFKHEPYTTILNQAGIEVLYGNYYCTNWQEWLKINLKYFDYVYLQRPHISVKYIDLVKQYSNAKVLYFAHDLHHVREHREYELTGDKEKLKSSQNWKKIEYELFDKADVGHVVGNYEQGVMQKVYPDKPIRNIPLYIYDKEVIEVDRDFRKRKDLIYVGGFGHPPNIDAVLWFGKEVFPLVLEKYPDIKWHVVGSRATEELYALASKNIIIEGFVSDDDLHRMYQECRLDIVPLRVGAGVKGKVVEAAYFQIPLVTTTIGAEGLDTSIGNMVIYDDAREMADAIIRLYEDYDSLEKMSKSGIEFIQKYFTEENAVDVLAMDIDRDGKREMAKI